VPADSKLKALHLPFAPSVESVATISEPRKANIRDESIRETELLAVVQLASTSPLQKVSWLRADGEEPVEYTIERDANGIPVEINVLGANPLEEDASTSETQSDCASALGGFTSMLANVASSTTFHAAVVVWLISDSSTLPFPSAFTTPALLATGVVLSLASRLRPL
jgi:hypothetical protein